jgi:hypothetical protein
MGIPYNVMRCDVDVCKDETIFIMTIQKNWWKKKGEEKKEKVPLLCTFFGTY